jgi:hypothetical protein
MIKITNLALDTNTQMLDQPWIYIILLTIGGILFLIQFKYMFFPTWKGRIIKIHELNPEDCTSCRSTKFGRASMDVSVKTEDGEIIQAEISPCTICLNKLQPGSSVGVSKIGTRNIAQPIGKIFGNSTW